MTAATRAPPPPALFPVMNRALVALNVSDGKDSQAMAILLSRTVTTSSRFSEYAHFETAANSRFIWLRQFVPGRNPINVNLF